MSDDDRFDDFLRQMSADYNRPPATPRDDMWKVIQAGLRESAPVATPGVVELRRSGAARWWPKALAAGLLLGAGIGIGRLMAPNGGDVQPTVAQRPAVVAESLPAVVAAAPDAPVAESPTGQSPTFRSPTFRSPTVVARSDNRPPRPSSERPAPGSERSAAPGSGNPTYRLATVRHLTEVEALLTSYRAATSQGTSQATMDAQVARWAREPLSNTRLLIDSPAATDPLRRRLLEDLELVLVQIVQLSPGGAAGDRDLIESTMKRGEVLTRLRTAIPAGQTSGT